MKIKKRIKNWYSNKPKTSVWFYITMILLIGHYLVKPVVWLSILRMGIVAPEVDITPTAERITEDVTESMLNLSFKMFEIGQGLSDSPYRFLIEGLLAFMFPYGLSLIFIYLFHGVIRHIVVEVYTKIKSRKKTK